MQDSTPPSRDLLPLSAAGCLAFLWPALSAFSIDDQVRRRIEAAAAMLGPVPRIALELRLGRCETSVDIHQMILRDPEDLGPLQEFLSKKADIYPPGLCSFLRQWCDPADVAHRCIDRLFLEWDIVGEQLGLPATFLPIDQKQSIEPSVEERSCLLEMLEKIAVGAHRGLTANLPHRIWHAATRGVSISHVGAMSGRGDLLRINYRRVQHGGLPALLATVGWPGDTAEAARQFDALVEIGDIVTVGIDVIGGQVTPDIGFEVFFHHEPAWEPRWKRLLDHLCTLGVCTEEKKQCLLNVTMQVHPYAPGQRWPAAWIVATEIAAPDALPLVDRELSHVKLSLSASGTLSSKAYISAQHRWVTSEGVATPRNVPRSIEQATTAAIEFLLRARDQNGWWTEFRTRRGTSYEWATAFVACCLASTQDSSALQAAREAVDRLLQRQRADGGWGYNADTPPDADSTAWVLRLFRSTGYEGEARARAIRFLAEHKVGSEGLSTYKADAPIQAPAPGFQGDQGWKSNHLCVLANAAPFVDEALLEALRTSQNQDGSWTPYWWRTPSLATALAAESLWEGAPDCDAVLKAIMWARSTAFSIDNLFAEAWVIHILALGGRADQELAQQRAATLLSLQRADGSWRSSADLKIPEPWDRDGSRAPRMDYESRHLFTTGAVLTALSLCDLQHLRKGSDRLCP